MAGDQVTVLLVEDNPGDARLVAELLAEAAGESFRLECADRLSAALCRLAQEGVDAVLLDLGLPDSQGLDTFVAVRAEAPDVPVVALTGLDDDTVAVEAVRAGAQDYLVKGSLGPALLVRCLRYAIERQAMQRDLKRRTRERLASEARLRKIIEVNADAIVVIDRSGVVQFVNPAAEALFGRKAKQLLGERFGFPVVAGEPSEIEVCSSSGESVAVEMRVVELEWDRQPAYLASLRNITDRKRAAEALRHSEARYRSLLECIPAVVYTAAPDRAGTTFYVSPQIEAILGFSPEDYTADPDRWRKQLHPDDRRRVLAEVERCRATGDPFQAEYRMLHRDGRVVRFRDQAILVEDETGAPRYVQGVMFDLGAPESHNGPTD